MKRVLRRNNATEPRGRYHKCFRPCSWPAYPAMDILS